MNDLIKLRINRINKQINKAIAQLLQKPLDNCLAAALHQRSLLALEGQWISLLVKELGCGGVGLQGEPQGEVLKLPPAPGTGGTAQPWRTEPRLQPRCILQVLPGVGWRKKRRRHPHPQAGGGESLAGGFIGEAAAQRRVLPGAMRGRGLLCGIALSLLLWAPPCECGVGGRAATGTPTLLKCLWLHEPAGRVEGRAGGGLVGGILLLPLRPAQSSPLPPRLRVRQRVGVRMGWGS